MLTRNQYELYYEIKGDGPLFILIHGLDSALQTFNSIANYYSKFFKVLLVDQLGHGMSPEAINNDYSLKSQAIALYKLICNLQLENEKAIILGHSFGARTACQFAQDYPNCVKALVFEDMDFVKKGQGNYPLALKIAERKKKVIKMETRSIKEMSNNLSKFYGKAQIAHILDKRAIQIGNKMRLLFKPWVTPLYSYHSAKSDFSKLIRDLKIPIICILANSSQSAVSKIGYEDMVSIKNEKLDAKGLNGNLELSLIQDAGHNVHGTKEYEFITELDAFFSKFSLLMN